MSEVHIRINKRFLERAVFVLIIIALAVALFLQPAGEVTSEELASVQEQVDALSAQNQNLTEQLETTQQELVAAREELETQEEEEVVEEETSQEPELSGQLSFSYDWSTTGGTLNAFIVEVDNGLEQNTELEVRVKWQGGVWEQVNPTLKEVFVRSGEQANVIFDELASNPGDGIDTLRVTVHQDGSLVEQDHIRVL